jgi:membrane-associated phospholipid phosphatase
MATYNHNAGVVATGNGTFMVPAFLGIAAFPSLHLGHMIILLVVALHTWRPFAYFMAAVTLLTFVSTIGFGWHYGIDAVGGILLALGMTYLVYGLMRRWDERRAAAFSPAPVHAGPAPEGA